MRSIYQVLTDRFARADQSTTAPCDTGARLYCGGTWQGIIEKLDYIQNMGFTAVRRDSEFGFQSSLLADLDFSCYKTVAWVFTYVGPEPY